MSYYCITILLLYIALYLYMHTHMISNIIAPARFMRSSSIYIYNKFVALHKGHNSEACERGKLRS